jgi:CheY-like chemotaxis protein
MSADASPDQQQLLRDAGAANYLTKPIDVESLLTTINHTFQGILAPG